MFRISHNLHWYMIICKQIVFYTHCHMYSTYFVQPKFKHYHCGLHNTFATKRQEYIHFSYTFGVYYPCDNLLNYQTGGSLTNTSGHNYFFTRPLALTLQ